jgi:hypothetical protein
MILYHYTTLSAMLSIFENQILWMSDSSTMNDPSEGKYIRSLIDNEIKNFFDGREIEAEWLEIELQMNKFYLTSFTSDGDNLNQWRSYADSGHGVAIGIYVNDEHVVEIPNRNGNATFSKCIYDENFQKSKIKEILDETHVSQADNKYQQAWQQLVNWSTIFKHPSYAYENEYRLIYSQQGIMPRRIIGLHAPYGHRKWRKGRYGLASYFEYKIDLKDIKRIGLGPNLFDESGSMIHEILSELAHDGHPIRPEIYKSKCPYR